MRLLHLFAHEILDSNGFPTLEVVAQLENYVQGHAQVPAGSSTGTYEAHELRDQDQSRFAGKGVQKAVEGINSTIKSHLEGQNCENQGQIDQLLIDLDGTQNKSRLGGNTIVGVSMAICRAMANARQTELFEYLAQLSGHSKIKLPQPMILLMEGGKHGNWATDIQEFMILPNQKSFTSFRDGLFAGASIFHTLGKILKVKNYDTGVGFEGAYCPSQLTSNEEAIELILQAIIETGYQVGQDFTLALDVAANEFFENDHYILKSQNRESQSSEQWLSRMLDWIKQYPIESIEDPFAENAFEVWSEFLQQAHHLHQNQETYLKEKPLQLVGDDLVTTNVERIQQAIEKKSMNATLIKLNQIGTVTETLSALKLSQEAGFVNIVSHRGAETTDDFIADLVLGTSATQCKFGGPDRGERIAKYNRLLRVESQLQTREA